MKDSEMLRKLAPMIGESVCFMTGLAEIQKPGTMYDGMSWRRAYVPKLLDAAVRQWNAERRGSRFYPIQAQVADFHDDGFGGGRDKEGYAKRRDFINQLADLAQIQEINDGAYSFAPVQESAGCPCATCTRVREGTADSPRVTRLVQTRISLPAWDESFPDMVAPPKVATVSKFVRAELVTI